MTGAALIGADGLWSNVRRQVVGDGAPRVSGHTTYRSVIPTEQMPEDLRWNAATLWAGPKCHIVHYPLSGWKVFNLVVTYHNDAPEPVAGKPVPVEEVRRGFAHVCERAQNIIRHGQDWRMWVLCDRDPVDKWVDGRVALLGDAAHPMLQYMAQGACMAMEDAVCLADSLARTDTLESGLETYRARRVLRTTRVQLMSRAMGDHVYHPAGPHAALRNAIMSAKSQPEWYAAARLALWRQRAGLIAGFRRHASAVIRALVAAGHRHRRSSAGLRVLAGRRRSGRRAASCAAAAKPYWSRRRCVILSPAMFVRRLPIGAPCEQRRDQRCQSGEGIDHGWIFRARNHEAPLLPRSARRRAGMPSILRRTPK